VAAIQTAVYSRGHDRATLVWHDVDEIEFVTLGELTDEELLALAAGNGGPVPGWTLERLS